MGSKKSKSLRPEVQDLKRSGAERAARLMTAAAESENLTRSKDTPSISRHIRKLG